MTSMSAIREKADNRLEAKKDYTDYEPGGRRVGRVKERFVSADDGAEYLDVKTGFLGLRSLLVPIGAVRTDRKRRILLLQREPTRAGTSKPVGL